MNNTENYVPEIIEYLKVKGLLQKEDNSNQDQRSPVWQLLNKIEKGCQKGYRNYEDDDHLSECGIQKNFDHKYCVYINFHDFTYDHMDTGKPEYYLFSDLKKAIDFIVSRGFPFLEFTTPRGNKLFCTEWLREDNTTVL